MLAGAATAFAATVAPATRVPLVFKKLRRSIVLPCLYERIVRDDVLVKVGRELRRPLLCCEIDIGDPEALLIAVGPLVVVQQTPEEVALHRRSLRDAAMELRQVLAQKHDAIGVQNASLAVHHVVRRAAVLR